MSRGLDKTCLEQRRGEGGALWGIGWHSARGAQRERNEDRCRVAHGVVAGCISDGIDGHPAGSVYAEYISWEVVRNIAYGFELPEAVFRASQRSSSVAEVLDLEASGMMIACAACDDDGSVRAARVGNTRVVSVVPGHGVQDVFAQPDEASASGLASRPRVCCDYPLIEEVQLTLFPGSALVLMTDGAALYPPQETVAEAATYAATCPVFGPRNQRAENAARTIVRAAQLHGSPDDATALVIARIA